MARRTRRGVVGEVRRDAAATMSAQHAVFALGRCRVVSAAQSSLSVWSPVAWVRATREGWPWPAAPNSADEGGGAVRCLRHPTLFFFFFFPFLLCVLHLTSHVLRAATVLHLSVQLGVSRGLRSPSGLSGAGQCDFLVMASCQFPKHSESRQLAAYARRRGPLGVSHPGLRKSLAPGTSGSGYPSSRGSPGAGPGRPDVADAAGQQRAACARAARAGRGAGRLLSLRSSRKLQRRLSEAVSVVAPRPAGHPCGATERCSAGRTRGRGSEAREAASGRSVHPPLKWNCCHV